MWISFILLISHIHIPFKPSLPFVVLPFPGILVLNQQSQAKPNSEAGTLAVVGSINPAALNIRKGCLLCGFGGFGRVAYSVIMLMMMTVFEWQFIPALMPLLPRYTQDITFNCFVSRRQRFPKQNPLPHHPHNLLLLPIYSWVVDTDTHTLADF